MSGTKAPVSAEVGIDRDRLQRRTLATLSGSQVLSGIANAGSVPAGSLLLASLTGSEAVAGLSQTSSLLGSAVFALPLAWLALRRGRSAALVSGYGLAVIGAITVVIAAVGHHVALLLVGTFLVGVASATSNQARFAATDLAREDRLGRAFAWVAWAGTIGAILGPNLIDPAGRAVMQLHLPELSGAYVMCAIALALAAVLVLAFLRPDPYLTSLRLGGQQRGGPPRFAEGWQVMRQRPRALLGIATIVTGHVVMVMVMVMTPVFMRHVDVSLAIIGLVISVHVAGMYALSPLVGWGVDRLGQVTVAAIGIVVLGAACAVCSVTPGNHDVMLGIGLFLLGAGWSCTLIAGSAMLTDALEPRVRPAVQGLSDLAMNAAGALGGIAAGLIVAALSYGALARLAAIPLVALAVALALPACRRHSNVRSI